ncbi:hypothetical protein CBR_g38190 [Chara braunii]|uniref:Uncharacterized protein n=1 Tax=Chara braunii TaxID=69332 RepID=A0A388LPG0_CHABU|nr:hypothetical protein CBR_g38190 [Chara braunii]|eukprot:GBG84218.1 hypothetical protein CBR_g38190 [Chara braunii]
MRGATDRQALRHQPPPTRIPFRMPTKDNLIPIRLDVEVEGRRLKDGFTWDSNEHDSEIVPFARRLVREQGLPGAFVSPVVQAMQSQISEFRAYETHEISMEERLYQLKLDLRVNNIVVKDQFLWDIGNVESDPEGFALQFCQDYKIADPEVAPAIAVAIREQLYELIKQSVAGRESRMTKKIRRERGLDLYGQGGINGTTALNLMRRPNNKYCVQRKKTEWEAWEPVVEVLNERELEALDARDQRNARYKREKDEREEMFPRRYR